MQNQMYHDYDIEDGLYILTYEYLNRPDCIAEKLYVDDEIVNNIQGRLWEELKDRFNALYEYRETSEDNVKWYVVAFKTKEEVELAIEYLNSLTVINKLRGDV